MAPTIASGGHAPTTLTLNPFHTDPQSRQTYHYQPRLPRIAQQTPQPISTPHIRGPRMPNHTSAFSKSVSAATSNNARNIHNSSLTIIKPTVVNSPSTLRASTTAAAPKTSNALSHRPKSVPNVHATRQPATTVAKVHAIAPIGAKSIDSILHAGSGQDASEFAVPDRIRPKAKAINTASPMTAIKFPDSDSTGTPAILYAHSDVLAKSSSPLLQTLLKQAAPKPQDQPQYTITITLPSASATSLNLYLNYLYTGSIHAGHRKDEAPTASDSSGYPGLSSLVAAYNLGHTLHDSPFRDAILDAVITLTNTGKAQGKTMLGLLMQRVKALYIALPAGSKGRKLFVHLFAHFGDWRLLGKGDSREFLRETGEVMKSGKADDPMVKAGRCVFHEHEVGEVL